MKCDLTLALTHYQVSLQERVRQLEEDLASEREQVRDRDVKIADLEQKLLQYQISELKSVLG